MSIDFGSLMAYVSFIKSRMELPYVDTLFDVMRQASAKISFENIPWAITIPRSWDVCGYIRSPSANFRELALVLCMCSQPDAPFLLIGIKRKLPPFRPLSVQRYIISNQSDGLWSKNRPAVLQFLRHCVLLTVLLNYAVTARIMFFGTFLSQNTAYWPFAVFSKVFAVKTCVAFDMIRKCCCPVTRGLALSAIKHVVFCHS